MEDRAKNIQSQACYRNNDYQRFPIQPRAQAITKTLVPTISGTQPQLWSIMGH